MIPTTRHIQEALIEAGYDVGPDGADGDFGLNTQKAIKLFEADHGLIIIGSQWTPSFLAALFPKRANPLTGWLTAMAIKAAASKLEGLPMFQALIGYRTYIALVVGAVTVLANHFFGPIPGLNLDPDGWITQLGTLIPLATIRAAIK